MRALRGAVPQIGLFTQALAAADGSKFKAVNTRDKKFTATKLEKRMEQVAEHIAGYLADFDTADRSTPAPPAWPHGGA